MDRIALSLTEGNPDNLGRLAWSGLVDEIQTAVTSFINAKNQVYNKAQLDKDIKRYEQRIHSLETQMHQLNELIDAFEELADPTFDNKMRIMEDKQQMAENKLLLDSYQFDLDHLKRQKEKSDKFRKDAPGFLLDGLPSVIHTRTFNEEYPITFGYISNCFTKDEWSDLFKGAELIADPNKQLADLQQRQMAINLGAGDCLTPEENRRRLDAVKTKNSRETLKTISSTFETPKWSNCGIADKHQWCCMPNTKRTPDIAVCVLPDQPKSSLMYPVFIGEIRGEKRELYPEDILYEGYNASLQTLAFAHRGYYWDIHVWESHLYKLQRNPKTGCINITKKGYNILRKNQAGHFIGLGEIIEDFARLFFDTLINMRPIASHAASALYKANYREFLAHALKGGRQRNVHDHCWHIFKLRFKGQNDERAPVKQTTDCEDPEDQHVPKLILPRPRQVQRENDSIPVNQNTFVHAGLDEDTKKEFPLPPNRAERGEDGEFPPVGTGVETSANRSLVTSMQMMNVLLQRVVKGDVSVLESTFEDITQDPSRSVIDEHIRQRDASTSLLNLTTRWPLAKAMTDVDLDNTVSQKARKLVGMYEADYVGNDLVIRGPSSKPFKGGFVVFPGGNLVYVKDLGTVGKHFGFKCSFAFHVNDTVATLLERIAEELDKNVQPGGGGGGGGGGGVEVEVEVEEMEGMEMDLVMVMVAIENENTKTQEKVQNGRERRVILQQEQKKKNHCRELHV